MTGRKTRRNFLTSSSATALGLTLAGCTSGLFDEPEFEDPLDPPAMLLTWQRDPTSTMTIDWHTDAEAEQTPDLDYRRAADGGEWTRASGDTHHVEHEDPTTEYDRDVHRVELTGLDPSTTYEFRFGTEPVWRFRTMPATASDPIQFASGGDTGHLMWESILEQLMEYDPEFVSICGDLAIGDGGRASGPMRLWKSWFDSVKEYLIDDDGRVVPIIAGIGNHECRNGYFNRARVPYEDTAEWREWHAPYFYTFFAFPGHPGYGVLDFGDYMSIPMLDTEHTNRIEGAQTEWLEDVLEDRQDVPHVFPKYHVPVYPAVDPQSNLHPPRHNSWPPLFEEYDVRFAFEHHIHDYKRTVPITDGERDEDGVVYMGDGCMGQMPPSVVDPDRWWIDRAESAYNVHMVTVDESTASISTIDDEGTVIDEVEREAVSAAAAQ